MSAAITREQRTIEVCAVYVDHLGYVRCTACQRDNATRIELPRPDSLYPTCDICKSDTWAKSREKIDVVATIEHVTCKIF